jgi:hypothetical protein
MIFPALILTQAFIWLMLDKDLLAVGMTAARSEHLVAVKWAVHLSSDEAVFRKRAGLFTTQLIVASLANQTKTLRFVEENLRVSLSELLESP